MSLFSDAFKNLLNGMNLSPLEPLALAGMPLRKLVSDTFPIDIKIIYIVEILIWKANMSFKLGKYGIYVTLLSSRTIKPCLCSCTL